MPFEGKYFHPHFSGKETDSESLRNLTSWVTSEQVHVCTPVWWLWSIPITWEWKKTSQVGAP